MTSPFSTDDLRTELRLQAREAEAWDLPPVALPRRTPPRRGWAVLAVSAALVVAVLVVPGMLGGSVTPIGPSGQSGRSAGAPDVVDVVTPVDYVDVGPACSDGTAASDDGGACWTPLTVMSDGRVLEGRGQEARAAAGGSFAVVTLDSQDGEDVWVMVAGRDGGHPAVQVGVAGQPATQVAASDSPTLLRLAPSEDGETNVSARWSGGAELVLRTFQPVASDPRADWLATLSACSDAGLGCIAPETVRIDGLDLQRSESGAEGRSDVRGRFDRPQPDAWLMLGTSEPDGGDLVVSVGGQDPVTVPADRPVLVRAPDVAPLDYSVAAEDGRPLSLFMWLYEPVS